MGLSFFETMRGHLRDAAGEARLAEFEIKAEASALGRFLKTGEARITGVVHAPPWADAAALAGTVRVSLARRRQIAYRFRFAGRDDATYELAGTKELSYLRPLKTFTELYATLSRVDDDRAAPAGPPVARGLLTFDLRDLPAFAASWWPGARIPHLDLDQAAAGQPAGHDPLTGHFDDTLAAIAETFIAPGQRFPAGDATTHAAAKALLLGLAGPIASGYTALLRWLDAAALARHGRRFARLDRPTRAALLERLADPGDSIADLATSRATQVLLLPFKMTHFDRVEVLDGLGHPRQAPPARDKAPRWTSQITAAEALEAVTDVEADVVIVGTGAGGAPLAMRLAQQGLAVALLDEGRFTTRADYVGGPLERIASLWRNRGLNLAVGAPLLVPTGRVVGGTTTINSGTCLPTPDHVLNEWRGALGFPDDFAPAAWAPYSETVRQILDVQPGTPEAVGAIGEIIGRGADALGLAHGPLPRNAPGCTGAGVCIFGCPEGAKRSTDVSYLPSALQAGASLFTGLPVTRILMRGRRAVALEARGADRFGAPKVLRVYARHVVLACGTLHTPLLLRDNGITHLPHLGRNLSVHPAMGLFGRMPEALAPWKGIPQGYGVEGHGLEGVRYEGYYLPPQFVASMLPWAGAELSRWMDDFDHLAQFGFMVRDESRGSVHRGPAGLPILRYRPSQRSLGRLKAGAALLAELLLAAGATEVATGVARAPIARTVAQARALKDLAITPFDLSLLGAHPLGTCRMGPDAARGVVDFDHRVFGTDNLYVVDGSVVPTSLGVNPQMTIMAFALRAADQLAALS